MSHLSCPGNTNPRRSQKAPGNAPKDQFPLDGIRESPSLPHPLCHSENIGMYHQPGHINHPGTCSHRSAALGRNVSHSTGQESVTFAKSTEGH